MKQVGETVSSVDVIRIVERDISFYFPDGGVTLSGGEPLCQPEFAAEVMSVLHDHGIATAVETSGCVSWDAVAAVAQWVDLFLVDLKHLDPEVHREYTGSDNKLIIENLRRLTSSGARIILRVPLVPGVNSDELHIRRLARFAVSLGIEEVDVLPLHKLAGHKYRRLGRDLPVFEAPSQSEVEATKKILEDQGLDVVVGG
jgi:pyruvate formate lyase activating enzyme